MKIFSIGGITVEPSPGTEGQNQLIALQKAMRTAGRSLARSGHDLLVCSPFDGSIDAELVRGAAEVGLSTSTKIEFYYPNSENVARQLDALHASVGKLSLVKFPQQPPSDESNEDARRHAWLLCQLTAMERCNLILAVGGKLTGPMSLLLLLAESKRKSILPLRFLGGAAEKCFERKQYEMQDCLGAGQIPLLSDPEVVYTLDALVNAVVNKTSKNLSKGTPPTFFLSYAKARPGDADFVEMVLRRRNLFVMRDDKDFSPGSPLPSEIRDYIHRADVFIAIWCKEYACSPWCFDELDLAIDRSRTGAQVVLLLNVDNTRVVPPKAREIVSYPATSREQLEAEIIRFLDRLGPSPVSGERY